MDSDDEEVDYGDETPQQHYYAQMRYCERHPDEYPGLLERLIAAGPPPPMERDGYWGQIAYYRHHAVTDPDAAQRLAELEAEGPPN
ncbi:hypothetical protein [Nocardia thraciensis]